MHYSAERTGTGCPVDSLLESVEDVLAITTEGKFRTSDAEGRVQLGTALFGLRTTRKVDEMEGVRRPRFGCVEDRHKV